MDHDLPPEGKTAHDAICVSITGEQHALKKHHAGRPDSSGTAKPRQDLLGDDRLNQKQQEGADKNGEGVNEHGAS